MEYIIDKKMNSFKEEFYKTKKLKIDTTKYLGTSFPSLGVIEGVTEVGKSFAYDESKKILIICTIIEEKKYFNELVNTNPEIFTVSDINSAWEAIENRIMLDYNLSVLEGRK